MDVAPDVLEAVRSLGNGAQRAPIVERAIEIGGWSEQELEARAWYTGSSIDSHIRYIVGQALSLEEGMTRRLQQTRGTYSLTDKAPAPGFGVAYRHANEEEGTDDEIPRRLADLGELDRATKRHMALQNRLADALRSQGVKPLSPAPAQPQFDLALEHAGRRVVVEVKGGSPVSSQQVRLGVGQVLEYQRLLRDQTSSDVEAALLVEGALPEPWSRLAKALGIRLLRADRLEESLTALLADEPPGQQLTRGAD